MLPFFIDIAPLEKYTIFIVGKCDFKWLHKHGNLNRA